MKSFLKRIINSALRPFGLVLRRDTLPGSQQMRTFNAVYCGNNRLLTTHPVRGLMYVDSTDVSVTPGVVMGSYEPHVQAVLMRLIKPGFVVV